MTEEEQRPPDLLVLSDGVPDVVTDERRLVLAGQALAAADGPVAVDAERASGHRYGNRAYLVQLRRRGAGTWLIDPMACPDLGPVADGIGDGEWVLHAATQDLPCLAAVGLRPTSLFDTELGGRLAGLSRVGLGAAVEHYLGVTLAKEHSAVDWSRRPLPEPWLRYAALDVEVLVELRDAVAADLQAQDKWDWAREEFDALLSFVGPSPRIDPWRRTSGMHKVRKRRGIAILRELWYARDRIAQRRDTSPGRVLSDSALIEMAVSPPMSAASLAGRRELKAAARNQREWFEAIDRARSIPEEKLPPISLPGTGPPPVRLWSDRDPIAAKRLARVRADLAQFAGDRTVPVENLLAPDTLRRIVWAPPSEPDEDGVAEQLRALGARHWQVAITAPIIVRAFADEA